MAQYNMGGVPTNYKAEALMVGPDGNTEVVVKGLMAAGVAACASVRSVCDFRMLHDFVLF